MREHQSILQDTSVDLGIVRERFFQKVTITGDDECWEWTGCTHPTEGYGRLHIGPRATRKYYWAHRLSYQLHKGEIPDGKCIDHVCRNRKCVNPKHLEPVSAKVNVLRGMGFSAMFAKRNKCSKGHEYTSSNTRIYKGTRRCRTCAREWAFAKAHSRS
jgi:hypothetical protein